MAQSNGKDFRASAVVKNLREIVRSLPGDAEKTEVSDSLRELIGFLRSLETSIASLPSEDEVAQAKLAIERLGGLLDRAKSNPVLAQTLGLRKAPSRSRTTSKLSDADLQAGKGLYETLQTLPVDEVRHKLHETEISLSVLRAIAWHCGIRSSRELSREALEHQIAMKIANYRGYQQLSGQTEETSVVKPIRPEGKDQQDSTPERLASHDPT
jgi:hypothetical protein